MRLTSLWDCLSKKKKSLPSDILIYFGMLILFVLSNDDYKYKIQSNFLIAEKGSS